MRTFAASCFLLALVSAAPPVCAQDWVPLAPGDSLDYTEAWYYGTKTQEVLNDWSPFYRLTDFAGLRRNNTGVIVASAFNSIYVADLQRRRWVKVLDFSAAVGDQWPINLTGLHRNGGVGTMKLADESDSISTPAGSFSCKRFDYRGPIGVNDGWESIWVARGVGVVKWTQRTSWGYQIYELQRGFVGGRTYAPPPPTPFPWSRGPATLDAATRANAQLLNRGTLLQDVQLTAGQELFYKIAFDTGGDSVTYTFERLEVEGFISIARYDNDGVRKSYSGSGNEGRETSNANRSSTTGSTGYVYLRIASQGGPAKFNLELRQ